MSARPAPFLRPLQQQPVRGSDPAQQRAGTADFQLDGRAAGWMGEGAYAGLGEPAFGLAAELHAQAAAQELPARRRLVPLAADPAEPQRPWRVRAER